MEDCYVLGYLCDREMKPLYRTGRRETCVKLYDYFLRTGDGILSCLIVVIRNSSYCSNVYEIYNIIHKV